MMLQSTNLLVIMLEFLLTDLTGTIRNHILVERMDFAFLVEIEYERLPLFSCKVIGHLIESCKKSSNVQNLANDQGADNGRKNNTGLKPRNFYIPKAKPNPTDMVDGFKRIENGQTSSPRVVAGKQNNDARNKDKDTSNEDINGEDQSSSPRDEVRQNQEDELDAWN